MDIIIILIIVVILIIVTSVSVSQPKFDSRSPFNLDSVFSAPPRLHIGGDLIEKGPLWVSGLFDEPLEGYDPTFTLPTDPVSCFVVHGRFLFIVLKS